jgi:hypothetical protein
MLAHGVHYAMVAAGLLGLAALLLPQVLHRTAVATPRDAHEARVLELRRRAAAGALADPSTGRLRSVAFRQTDRTAALVLPIALVGSTTAAGAHAAVTPPHLSTAPVFAAFFATCAIAQLAWTGLMLVAPSRQLVLAGLVGNLGLLALWAVSRLVGLPFGLLPRPEPIGAWDLACALWEAGVVVACVLLLRTSHPRPRTAAWLDWRPGAQAWLALAAGGLAVLSLTGAHA